jgi:hypothetical protein
VGWVIVILEPEDELSSLDRDFTISDATRLLGDRPQFDHSLPARNNVATHQINERRLGIRAPHGRELIVSDPCQLE